MLQAMNTGHEGSLSTVHANSPRDALNRLETMVLMAGYELPVQAIRSHVSSALDLIIQLDRLDDGSPRGRDLRSPAHGGRGDHASEAVRVQDRPFRRRSQDRRRLHHTGLRPGFLGKFERHGIRLPLQLVRRARPAPSTVPNAPALSRAIDEAQSRGSRRPRGRHPARRRRGCGRPRRRRLPRTGCTSPR